VLAVDTSCAVETLALVQGELALAQWQARRPKHRGASLASTIEGLLASCGRSMGDLSAAVVVGGPGAFTGLRVGIATLQGLCAARRIPLSSVSALDGWAWAATTDVVGVTLDARRGELYTALFRRTRDALETLIPLDLVTPDAWAVALGEADVDVELVGDGARLYETRWTSPRLSVAPAHVLGPNLIPVARAVDVSATPGPVAPIYMRRHDGTRTEPRGSDAIG